MVHLLQAYSPSYPLRMASRSLAVGVMALALSGTAMAGLVKDEVSGKCPSVHVGAPMAVEGSTIPSKRKFEESGDAERFDKRRKLNSREKMELKNLASDAGANLVDFQFNGSNHETSLNPAQSDSLLKFMQLRDDTESPQTPDPLCTTTTTTRYLETEGHESSDTDSTNAMELEEAFQTLEPVRSEVLAKILEEGRQELEDLENDTDSTNAMELEEAFQTLEPVPSNVLAKILEEGRQELEDLESDTELMNAMMELEEAFQTLEPVRSEVLAKILEEGRQELEDLEIDTELMNNSENSLDMELETPDEKEETFTLNSIECYPLYCDTRTKGYDSSDDEEQSILSYLNASHYGSFAE